MNRVPIFGLNELGYDMSSQQSTSQRVLRILCIEDHPLDRQILARQLIQPSFFEDVLLDVHFATTLGEAVMLVREHAPDVCLVDLYLPDSHGIETLHSLRRILPHCAIVVVTATDDASMLRHAIYANIQGYLVKGEYSATALLRTIVAAWERAQLERQLAEITEQLKQSHAQYRTLLEFLPDAVIMTDLSGRILYLNGAAQELLGRSTGELIGEELAHPQISTDYTSDVAIPQRNGRLRYATLRTQRAIVSGQDVLIYFLHDVTQRRRHENEHLVRQRNDVLGMIASGIAHDINNLLSPIMLGVQTLLRTASDERTRNVLTMIEQSAKRGAELVRQVLSFSRSIDTNYELIHPADIIEEIERYYRRMFPPTVELVTRLSPNHVPLVVADRGQLIQALECLVSNAADALDDKGGAISVAAYPAPADDPRLTAKGLGGYSYVVFEVSDTGHGIPEHIYSTMFEPFVTTKPNRPGLGLFTVRTIVKRHRGAIDVESNQNGTRVSLFFPTNHIHDSHHAGVLVVTPSATLRHLITATLEAASYRVFQSQSPAEALTTFLSAANSVDIVLVDHSENSPIPQEKLRAMKDLKPELQIILLCGLLERETLAALEGNVVSAFLAKPITERVLLETIASLHQRTPQSSV